MIRVVLFLLMVGAVALSVGWIADRPGEVAITWQGWRIDTSVMVMIVAAVAFAIAVSIIWSILRAIIRAPHETMRFWQRRRGRQGYLAISKGLIAIGAGDASAARKYAEDARRLAPQEPLALLLGAQTAQMSGNRDEAERSFRAMAAREDTKLLGLHGLFIEAQRRDDLNAARLFAEEAAASAPSLPWAGQAVLQFRCAAEDWQGALDILARNRSSGALDRDAYRRQRAVLTTAQAIALEETDRDRSRALVLEAVKLAPSLIPAVALAARFLSESEEFRKASRMIEKAWQAHPHPDLADAYANLRLGDSARDRLSRVQALAEKAPGHVESALAVARAGMAAREFAVARAALDPFLDRPMRRVALTMAEIEEADRGDEGRAREWMRRALTAQRDPTWTADGFVSDRWMPMSPVSGRLDAFEWKVPLAEIEDRAAQMPEGREPLLVVEARSAPSVEAAPVPEPIQAAPQSGPEAPPPVKSEAAVPPSSIAHAVPAPKSTKSHPRIVEPIVPLVHVPDDPGPEPEGETEPTPAASQPGWRGLLG